MEEIILNHFRKPRDFKNFFVLSSVKFNEQFLTVSISGSSAGHDHLFRIFFFNEMVYLSSQEQEGIATRPSSQRRGGSFYW